MIKTPTLELVVDNVPEETIPAKPGRKEPPSGDWLTDMPIDTWFFVKDRSGRIPRWMVLEYIHAGVKAGHVLLVPTSTMNDPKTWMWVYGPDFCKDFEFRSYSNNPETDPD